MLKIGRLQLGVGPRIALSISDRENYQEIKKAKADLLEIRFDCFKTLDQHYLLERIKRLRRLSLPLILTIRAKNEGGRANIAPDNKLAIFSFALPYVDAIDIELKSPILKELLRLARINKKSAIISLHDFKATPSEKKLEAIIKKAKSLKADILKIAAKANCQEDVIRLLLFAFKHRKANVIIISLGRIGSVSRILFPFFGSLLTYSCLRRSFAPGQFQHQELLDQLRCIT